MKNCVFPTGCRADGLRLLVAAAIALGIVSPASARVTQMTITAVESPTFGGASFGSVGQYERIEGTISGAVDPDNRLNAVIVDIEHAPRNANGTVSYSADFQIIRPIDLGKGNHRILFDLPNRGGPLGLSTFNDSRPGNNTTTAGSPGNGFLMNQGYTLVEGAWDTTVLQGASATGFGVTFPVAKNRDGSSITGPTTEELVVDFTATPAALPLTYPAATADQSKALLTVRANYGDTPMRLPSSAWAYTDGTLKAIQLTSGKFGVPPSFGPTALYEFTYIAKDPIVSGLGFASVRDLADFLRNAKADDNGVANPMAGDVQHIYSYCLSQPCRTMHDFVLWGFNEVERAHHDGRDRDRDDHRDGDDHHDGDRGRHEKAFDGVLNWIGGGDGIYMNYRFAQPFRTHRQHIARWTPEFQFPWANQRTHDRVTGQTAGRLDRCLETDTCPKIIELNSENEFYSKGGSLLTTDTAGHDLDLGETPNVRYYLLSSAPHGAGTAAGICQQPQNPIVGNQVLRALLTDLDQWVSTGREPPANRVPRRGDGTLVSSLPQSGQGFPNIPGVTYNGIMHTGDLWDFGPRFDDGIVTISPPILLGTPYPVFVPKTDADGNDIAGVRTPDVAVPIATYTGWALRASPATETSGAKIIDGCDASGQRLPFQHTKAQRMAIGDPRPSLEERYPDHQTYVNMVAQAAQKLEAERLLVDMDVQAYIAAAQAAAVP
ncbi:MAG TPA: alpha/beta hydrolase domain-containing protein [Stellaceae bacterium]|nr:alpha/beta hydrolase domain-containing protein [Stellaceae bacterium]